MRGAYGIIVVFVVASALEPEERELKSLVEDVQKFTLISNWLDYKHLQMESMDESEIAKQREDILKQLKEVDPEGMIALNVNPNKKTAETTGRRFLGFIFTLGHMYAQRTTYMKSQIKFMLDIKD